MVRKSNRTILNALEVNIQVMNFLDEMESLGQPEIAAEFLLSQVSHLVSLQGKRGQREFFEGMENTLKEEKYGLE